MRSKLVLVMIFRLGIYASIFGEENAALWRIVGLETKSLVEISEMLGVAHKQLSTLEKAYDTAEAGHEQVNYGHYLVDRAVNVKEELEREKSLYALKNNLTTVFDMKGDAQEFVGISDKQAKKLTELNKKQDKRIKKRDKRIEEELSNTSKLSTSNVAQQTRQNRVGAMKLEVVNDLYKETRNMNNYVQVKDKEERLKQDLDEYYTLKFLGVIPNRMGLKRYLRQKKRGRML